MFGSAKRVTASFFLIKYDRFWIPTYDGGVFNPQRQFVEMSTNTHFERIFNQRGSIKTTTKANGG